MLSGGAGTNRTKSNFSLIIVDKQELTLYRGKKVEDVLRYNKIYI